MGLSCHHLVRRYQTRFHLNAPPAACPLLDTRPSHAVSSGGVKLRDFNPISVDYLVWFTVNFLIQRNQGGVVCSGLEQQKHKNTVFLWSFFPKIACT